MSNPDGNDTRLEDLSFDLKRERARQIDVEEKLLQLTLRLLELEAKTGKYS